MGTIGRKILVVDDNPEFVDFIRRVLESHDFRVSIALDGKTAIEKALFDIPELVLLDLKLPDIPGEEQARRRTSVRPRPPSRPGVRTRPPRKTSHTSRTSWRPARSPTSRRSHRRRRGSRATVTVRRFAGSNVRRFRSSRGAEGRRSRGAKAASSDGPAGRP